jgi:hypothetical protein
VNGGWLAQASRVRELIPGGSNGMTRCGSSSAFWLYASKPVGGENRQIRSLIQPRAASVRDVSPVSSEPCWQEKCLARPTVPRPGLLPHKGEGSWKNTRSIGRTCKAGDRLSRPVLTAERLTAKTPSLLLLRGRGRELECEVKAKARKRPRLGGNPLLDPGGRHHRPIRSLPLLREGKGTAKDSSKN